jgi:hypothetical protein
MLPAIQPSQHAVQVPQLRRATGWSAITLPQHFLYFFPLLQGQGSFRGTLTGP